MLAWTVPANTVLADYNNVAQLIADDQQVGGIPYIWTKDGDSIVDNVDSSTNENWCVIGGADGDLPATVETRMTVAGMSAADVYVGRLDWKYNQYIDPEFLTNATLGTISVGASYTTFVTIPIDDAEFPLLAGRKFGVMIRGDENDSSNNINLRTSISPGGAYYSTEGHSSNWGTAGTAPTIDMSPEIFMVQDEELYRTLGITRAGTVQAEGNRTSGTANFIIHAAQIFPSPMTRFRNLSAGTVAPSIVYVDGRAFEVTSGTNLAYTYKTDGNLLQVSPNKYNVLISWLGNEQVLSEPTDTLTYNAFYVTPRWKVQ